MRKETNIMPRLKLFTEYCHNCRHWRELKPDFGRCVKHAGFISGSQWCKDHERDEMPGMETLVQPEPEGQITLFEERKRE